MQKNERRKLKSLVILWLRNNHSYDFGLFSSDLDTLLHTSNFMYSAEIRLYAMELFKTEHYTKYILPLDCTSFETAWYSIR